MASQRETTGSIAVDLTASAAEHIGNDSCFLQCLCRSRLFAFVALRMVMFLQLDFNSIKDGCICRFRVLLLWYLVGDALTVLRLIKGACLHPKYVAYGGWLESHDRERET